MNTVKMIASAAAVVVGLSTSAQASTTGSGAMWTASNNRSFEVTFNVMPGVFDQTTAFQIGYDFNLNLSFDLGQNGAAGYFVNDAAGNLVADTTFNFSTSTCANGSGTADDCNLVFGFESSPKTLFTNLEAGFYNFGVYGATVQSPATIAFEVSKVPLPAGGLLLLGALGALGLKRRRKAA